mmetsp:Transcript_158379/g.295338  ORF Transcript_158379/g.295338 Transcript_158379/m.295338 type:complete len:213 (+) Transcript_158379:263-901(+)
MRTVRTRLPKRRSSMTSALSEAFAIRCSAVTKLTMLNLSKYFSTTSRIWCPLVLAMISSLISMFQTRVFVASFSSLRCFLMILGLSAASKIPLSSSDWPMPCLVNGLLAGLVCSARLPSCFALGVGRCPPSHVSLFTLSIQSQKVSPSTTSGHCFSSLYWCGLLSAAWPAAADSGPEAWEAFAGCLSGAERLTSASNRTADSSFYNTACSSS